MAGLYRIQPLKKLVLSNYIGGEKMAGNRLKESDTTHWAYPNDGADDRYGFSALPGGQRLSTGEFYDIRYWGNWWSATKTDTTTAWSRQLQTCHSYISRNNYAKNTALSVRCAKD
jgi:uncharacterized protein (TIGR02145 family)